MIEYRESTLDEAFPAIFEACKTDFLRLSYEDALKNAYTYDFAAVVIDGVIVGGMMFKGQEMHLAIKPEYRKRWITKNLFKFWAKQKQKRGGLWAYADPGSEWFVSRVSCSVAIKNNRNFYQVLTDPKELLCR